MIISNQVQALLNLPQHEIDRSFRDQKLISDLIATLKQHNHTIGERCANDIFRMLTRYSHGVTVTLNYPDATDLINDMARIIDMAISPPGEEPQRELTVTPPTQPKGTKL